MKVLAASLKKFLANVAADASSPPAILEAATRRTVSSAISKLSLPFQTDVAVEAILPMFSCILRASDVVESAYFVTKSKLSFIWSSFN